MNSALLNRVADFIEAHPESYNQKEWLSHVTRDIDNDLTYSAIELAMVRGNRAPPLCDTQGCVAGWAVWHTDPDEYIRILRNPSIHTFAEAAQAALDLPLGIALWLFSGGRSEDTMPAVLRHMALGERPWSDPAWSMC